MPSFLVIIIILALVFDYINGFHDAANSIATIVSTKVLTPFQAVLWAAVLVGWVGRALQVQEKTSYGRQLQRIGLVLLVVALVGAAAAAWLLVS